VKIGMLLTAGVAGEGARTALRIARAARAKGHEVELFLMDDGVYAVKRGKRTPLADELASLVEGGATASLCALNAEQRGVAKDEAAPGVVFGSQYDLAQLIDSADRFLSFG
jgi:sulfur relay (sulfurtransferase) complex TusBCD TusD component (DsrE family)